MRGDHNSQSNRDEKRLERIRSVSISLASPVEIRKWSNGEVTKPVAFNARIRSADGSFEPRQLADGGLLCQKIFGPVVSFRCACGKYQGGKEARANEGKTCDRCNVLVAHRSVRCHRLGHIELAAPVVHPFFYRGSPSILTDLFKVVLDVQEQAKSGPLTVNSALIEKIVDRELSFIIKGDDQEKCEAKLTGAEGIKSLLTLLDGVDVGSLLREAIKVTKSRRRKQTLATLLHLYESAEQGSRVVGPESMVLDVIAVVPPVSRRERVLKDRDANGQERIEVGDLNRLYGRVIRANIALKELLEIKAPAELVCRRKRSLQSAVDALFENESLPRPVKSTSGRPLGSLLGLIKGKSGRFRSSLLGKRVDYSGRAVIVVNPKLRLWQCGLPERIAEELYRPFVLRRLESIGLIAPDLWLGIENKNFREQLSIEMSEHPVLLNRAPTLHRMGLQSFFPILSTSNAIELHPLVCRAFTADFDGDQMAVHLPLSIEAQVEAKTLLASSNNLLSAANGRVMFTPSQDMIMGLYYMTIDGNPAAEAQGVFASCDELELAREIRKLKIHDVIEFRVPVGREVLPVVSGKRGKPSSARRIKTTVGRALFNGRLANGLPFYNCALSANKLVSILEDCFALHGRKETLRLAEQLANIGFSEATRSGLSLSADDLIVPDSKGSIVAAARKKARNDYQQESEGKLSKADRKERVIKTWSAATSEVATALIEALRNESRQGGAINPVLVMAESGARGSVAQIKQLSGMRGLMQKANGEVAEHPITSNFREGLNLSEYFVSAHGSRKSFSDVGLKTAEGGYLMRRLVHATSPVVVTTKDCGSKKGLVKRARHQTSLGDIVCGRVSLDDIRKNGEVLVPRNGMISPGVAKEINTSRRKSLRVRSPLMCEAPEGVCQLCYGMDRSTQRLVELGTAVGVIAAQSIGEPGTQLTMITKHTGGIAGDDITGGLPRVEELLEARCPQLRNIFRAKGTRESAGYLLQELQSPYCSQGVSIDDKHFEIVIGQMLGKVRVDRSGDTNMVTGTLVGRREFARSNASLSKQAKKAQGKGQLLGITAVALAGDSFLSAASFREPKQVLRAAALCAQKDELTGITEKVIVGGLIPAGTGYLANEVEKEELQPRQVNLSMTGEETCRLRQQGKTTGKLSVILIDSKDTIQAEYKDNEQELELLITKLEGGPEDQNTWNRVVELIWDRLFTNISRTNGIDEGIARRLTGNIINDIVQSEKRFPSMLAFWKFVWRRCKWELKNYLLRDLKRRRREREILRGLLESDSQRQGREREAEEAGDILATMKAEAKLTGYQTKVFDLAWEKCLSDSVIAQRLEKTEGAIRRMKSHIKGKLRMTATALKLRETSSTVLDLSFV